MDRGDMDLAEVLNPRRSMRHVVVCSGPGLLVVPFLLSASRIVWRRSPLSGSGQMASEQREMICRTLATRVLGCAALLLWVAACSTDPVWPPLVPGEGEGVLRVVVVDDGRREAPARLQITDGEGGLLDARGRHSRRR